MLKKHISLLRTNIVNRWWFFPSQKIRILKKEIKKLQGSQSQKKESLLASLIAEYVAVNRYERKNKKQSIEWHAILRGKLRIEKKCCEKCGSNNDLTLDHIVPQSFIRDLGMNPDYDYNTKNFRLLCRKCNSEKGSHFDFSDLRTEVLIKEYLGRVKWKRPAGIDRLPAVPAVPPVPMKADVILSKPINPDR